MSSEIAYGDPETRRRILSATWEVVEEEGAAMKLSDVADRAGVSRQAVYLHFGDRVGLLVALVRYMDEVIEVERLAAPIFAAATPEQILARLMEVHSIITPKIDSVARVLESAQYQDEALATAWRDRMEERRAVHRIVARRIAEMSRLGPRWTVEKAGDVLYVLTMPGLWRELTQELGWSASEYAARMTTLLQASLLRD